MKRMLSGRARRWGYDGWALKVRGANIVLDWTTCTTRREARELRASEFPQGSLFDGSRIEVVKVKIEVREVASSD